jgi:hypothetical protein
MDDDDRRVSRALSLLIERMARRSIKQMRKPSLARFIKQARKLGLAVSGATLATDGSVSLTFGESQQAEASNPWLAEIDRMTKQ